MPCFDDQERSLLRILPDISNESIFLETELLCLLILRRVLDGQEMVIVGGTETMKRHSPWKLAGRDKSERTIFVISASDHALALSGIGGVNASRKIALRFRQAIQRLSS